MSDSPPNSTSRRQIVLADPDTNPVLNDRTNRAIETYLSKEADTILRILSESEEKNEEATSIFQMISTININLHLMSKKDMQKFLDNLNSKISSVKNNQLKIVLLALFNKMCTECRDLITKQQEIELQNAVSVTESHKATLKKAQICELLTRTIKETVPVGLSVGGSYAFKRAFENQLNRLDLLTPISTFFSQGGSSGSCIDIVKTTVTEGAGFFTKGVEKEITTLVPIQSTYCDVMRGVGSIFGYAGEVAGSGKEATLLLIMLVLTIAFYILLRILNSNIKFMGSGVDFKFKTKKSITKSLKKTSLKKRSLKKRSLKKRI
jgi:hypothetical protein